MRRSALAAVVLAAASAGLLAEEVEPGPVVVVVTATPVPAGAGELGRAVEVVGRDEMESSRAASPAEALERLTWVSVSERGDWGVQSDLSLRGSTYQQVLVCLDGLPAGDSQTAHHSMDLPVPAGAVERIEVVPGPGGALFGPTAFAGAVNVVTRRPERSGFGVSSAFGSFDTCRAEAVVDSVHAGSAASVATSYARSDGFMDGTDYESFAAWGSYARAWDGGSTRISAGRADRDFGAADFYASYPSHETTGTTFVEVAPEFELGGDWTLDAAARYRRHDDEFVLIESNPSFYRNRHRTEGFIERLALSSGDLGWGRLSLGLQRSDDSMTSSSLGERSASVGSAFAECRLGGLARWKLDLGLRADDFSRWGTEVSPSLGVSVKAGDSATLRLAAGSAVRPPSFTELYYSDPMNSGDPDLRPEEARGFEAGLDLELPRGVTVSATYFLRDCEDLIDWVRAVPADPWQATNTGEATTSGTELLLGGDLGRLSWRAGYAYTDVDASSGGMESKYALNFARHGVRAAVALKIAGGWSASADMTFRDVPTLGDYALLSAGLSWRRGAATVFVRGSNLLGEDYEEIPGVPTAGRAVEAGVGFAW